MSSAACADEFERVSVCSLVAHAEKYLSHRIEIEAQVGGDGMDYVLLVDRACANGQIFLSLPENIHSPQIEPLWAAIYHDGIVGTLGKEIHTTVLGTFTRHEAGWPHWQLDLQSVKHLDVKHIPLDVPKE